VTLPVAYERKLATQEQAEGLTDNFASMSPLRTFQAINQRLDNGPIPITTMDISNAIGNYVIVDDVSKLPAPSGGEHPLDPGVTYEFVDNNITGVPPFFVNALRIPDGFNIVIRAPLTINAIIYLGAGAFIRASAAALYVQSNIVLVTPFGTLWDITMPGGSMFQQNMAYIGLGLGTIRQAEQVTFDVPNLFEWTTGITLFEVISVRISGMAGLFSPTGTGSIIKIDSSVLFQIIVSDGVPELESSQSFLEISPVSPINAVINLKDNAFGSFFGGEFFDPGLTGTIISVADNSSTGSILSFADNGAGETTVTATAALPASIVDARKITQTGTVNYNDTYVVFNVVAGVSYDIPTPFVADDAAGTFDFNSVTYTTGLAHTLIDGGAVQIYKAFIEYNKGRAIFDASGSVFSVDNVIFQAPGGATTGEWVTSLKQDDGRFSVTGNGDQQDTAQIFSAAISTPETLVIIADNTPVDITSWILDQDRQFTFSAPGEDMGSFRYDGRDITSTISLTISGEISPSNSVGFSIYKKPEGGSYSIVGTIFTTQFTNKVTSITAIFPGIQMTSGDVFKATGERLGGSGNIIVDFGSISSQKVAQGFE
jgi:hypothetical protein